MVNYGKFQTKIFAENFLNDDDYVFYVSFNVI